MQSTQKRGQMPAIQRIQQSTNPVKEELQWIKDNSTSVKAVRQAGKALLSFELGELYAEKAYTFHELKENQSEEKNGRHQKTTSSRFQSQQP